MDGWTDRQTSDELKGGQTERWTGRKGNRKSRKWGASSDLLLYEIVIYSIDAQGPYSQNFIFFVT
jgi:hypothetical protein